MSTEKSRRYVINGKEYDNLESVPPELRGLLADADGDGMPDFVQAAMDAPGRMEGTTVIGSTSYTINGVRYASLEEMPPEVRKHFQSMGRLLANVGAQSPAGANAPEHQTAAATAPGGSDFPDFSRGEKAGATTGTGQPKLRRPARMVTLLLLGIALGGLGLWSLQNWDRIRSLLGF